MYLALTLVLHASNDIIYEGCLLAEQKWRKRWKRKYFALQAFGGFRDRPYKMRHFTKEKKDFKVFLIVNVTWKTITNYYLVKIKIKCSVY